jgi:hypothetical protein
MLSVHKKIIAICVLVVFLSSCSSLFEPPVNPAHANFERIMKSKIGKKYDDPPNFAGNPEQLVSSITQLNGNMVNGYRLNPSCIYYFEINPDTRKIVGWRYTGSKQDCVIAP